LRSPTFPEPDDNVVYFPAEPKKSAVLSSELTEDLYTIFGQLNQIGSEPERVEFLMEEKGLGSLPAVLSSLGSLLLFNSSINPYKNYVAEDNLVSSGKAKAVGDIAKSQMASAPTTVLTNISF